MINVMRRAKELSFAIAESAEYTEYISLLKKIQEETDLYSRLNEYRKRSFYIQISNDTDAIKHLEELQTEFSELLSDGKVSRFLSAEQAFCKMMRQMNAEIMGSIEEMDISFL